MAGTHPIAGVRVLAALLVLSSCVLVYSAESLENGPKPIRKVITLIEEMKATVEKEAKADEKNFEKYECWCKTETARATAAVEENTATIDELTAFLEEAVAREKQLTTEIASLTKEIQDAKDAIAEALSIRQKEKDAFLAAEADMKETMDALYQAVDVLDKVQLAQKKKRGLTVHKQQEASAALVQVRNVISRHYGHYGHFRSQMQKDLFDVLNSLELKGAPTAAALDQLRNKLLPGRELLPWEKTEEQVGMEEKPNDAKGMAAGAKSYNAQSGQILGILKEMLDEFSRDLADAQKADFMAEVAFQKLNAAKLGEIAAATKQKEAKEKELAELQAKMAKAKEDVEILTGAVEKDQAFLADVEKMQEKETAEYNKRVKARSLEVVALSETLKILTQDDARDLYAKTMTFVQLRVVRHRIRGGLKARNQARATAEDNAKEKVMRHLVQVAKRHENWSLAALALRVRLDSFDKIKKMMDKMLVDLKKQQKEEYEKHEFCKKVIDETEDKIWEQNNIKDDLAEKHKDLVNTLETLTAEIAELNKQEAATEVALKEAGEQRKEENQLFQSSVADQRACINILNKALARLRSFYGFVQGNPAKAAERKAGWSGASKAPSAGADYEKSGGGGGVIQLLMKIISDAQSVEAELVVDENNAQEDYAGLAQEMTDSILADRDAIAANEKKVASTEAEKAETEQAQLANEEELTTLKKLLMGHHAECDYIIKYFDIRQTSRQEEMDSIVEAKAILSGAKFS